MKWTTLAVVAGLAVSGWAGSLSVSSGVQWYAAPFPDLAGYTQLVNGTIEFINDDLQGQVRTIEPLSGGPGVTVSQSLGGTFSVGGSLVLLRADTSTAGTWRRDDSQYSVGVSLAVGMVAGLAELRLSLVEGLLQLGLAGGWGMAWLNHHCEFALPEGWTMPFVPREEDRLYQANGFLGQVGIRAMLPLRPGLALGTEGGYRFAPFGVPHADGEELDLSQDGRGDRLDFSGVWIGLSVTLTFDL